MNANTLPAFLAATDLDSLKNLAESLIEHMPEPGIFVSDDQELEYFRACRKLGKVYSDLAGQMLSYMILDSEFSF